MSIPWSLHELHTMLVHFPIALFSVGLLWDILSEIFKKEELESAGFWAMAMGVFSSIFTLCSGIITFLDMASITDLLTFKHGLTELLTIVLLAVLFWVRVEFQLELRFSKMKRTLYLCLHVLAVGLLFFGAHLGVKTAGRI